MTILLHPVLLRNVSAVALTMMLGTYWLPPAVAQEQATQEDTAAPNPDQIDLSSFAADEDPPAFENPAAALEAFKAAVAEQDVSNLAVLLGLDPEKLKADDSTKAAYDQIRQAAAELIKTEDAGDRQIINLGSKLWPFPFPLVKGEDGKWSFDTFAGLEEIVNRRVGENELQAINTMREYLDAQREYASEDRDGDGVLEYAQKVVSSDGKTDGLYWPENDTEGESPAGNFANEAALEKAKQGEGYFGYRFRILKQQGDNIAGGSYDYVINDNMIAGFALIAWPVRYEETGVNTFVVNQNGIVYQADLGPSTEAIVKYIDSFNPGDEWSVVGD